MTNPDWSVEVEVECNNLTPEQERLAYKIIDKNKDIPIGIVNILDALSDAGFRGEFVSRTQLHLPYLIRINSKVEKKKKL